MFYYVLQHVLLLIIVESCRICYVLLCFTAYNRRISMNLCVFHHANICGFSCRSASRPSTVNGSRSVRTASASSRRLRGGRVPMGKSDFTACWKNLWGDRRGKRGKGHRFFWTMDPLWIDYGSTMHPLWIHYGITMAGLFLFMVIDIGLCSFVIHVWIQKPWWLLVEFKKICYLYELGGILGVVILTSGVVIILTGMKWD